MKKSILIILLMGIFFSLSAQLLEEGFESCYVDSNGATVLPAGWIMVDNDGDSYNWFTYSFSPHSGAKSIASASYLQPPVGVLTPDNWLISPAIVIPDSTTLSWWAATQDPVWPIEHYSVMLSVSGNAIEDFTTELYNETLNSIIWHQVSVSLLDYAGETIHLAWRHHASTDNFYMKIDDILVTSGVSESESNVLVSIPNGISKVYPNPFNPETTISFNLEETGNVELSVYNMKGQKITELISGVRASGGHNVIWQAGNQPSGMYLFRLLTDQGSSFGKAMLMK
ncbi:MAG: choice-of-anchor J domain-containing protein [Candidatus Cloacimonetes bacterium]|nr:choice-of-anchor J domain-containing protein [Candidatus Cloacimonadota bacterium]